MSSSINLFWWRGSKWDTSVCPDLFEETGMSVEARVSLEYDEDNVWDPAHKSQHHTATQEEPVVGVVVDQALQSMRYQRLTQSDLTGDRQAGLKDKRLFSKSKYVVEKMERRFVNKERRVTSKRNSDVWWCSQHLPHLSWFYWSHLLQHLLLNTLNSGLLQQSSLHTQFTDFNYRERFRVN